jgi:predicted nucleotide-binding protein
MGHPPDMKKSKVYARVLFPAEVVKEAIDAYIKEAVEGRTGEGFKFTVLQAGTGQESWTFDSVAEFIAEYAKRPTVVNVQDVSTGTGYGFSFMTTAVNPIAPNVTVTAPTREKIETVFNIFDLNEAKARIPAPAKVVKPPEPLRIFIGHGGSQQWRDLKDHLHDKHHVNVEAYEVGARAGHTIRDILEDMLGKSSFACLVLTGEDELKGGELLARQNVIHEVGLFQGRLGFARAIVLLEEGTKEFSNIAGVQQIRFSKNNIKETFGEVLATIKREFPDS